MASQNELYPKSIKIPTVLVKAHVKCRRLCCLVKALTPIDLSFMKLEYLISFPPIVLNVLLYYLVCQAGIPPRVVSPPFSKAREAHQPPLPPYLQAQLLHTLNIRSLKTVFLRALQGHNLRLQFASGSLQLKV